ncbi:glycosyl transferase family 8 [Streptococcus pneumoniae]|nr:glycosyl transferase family 8 [Streptococcus pneumoniae]
MDSDIVVRKSIDELWDLDLTAIPLAAVRDDFYTHNFNSGVLLINNGMWRAENVTQDLIPKFQVEVSHPKEIHLATCSPSIF